MLPTKTKATSLLLGRLLLPFSSSYVVSTRTYYWPLVMLDPDDHRALLPTKNPFRTHQYGTSIATCRLMRREAYLGLS